MTQRGRGRPPHPDVLTPAEWQVLDWIRHGVGRREIARRRGTSLDAVKYHVRNITAKLGVGSSRELRRWPGFPASAAIAHRRESVVTDRAGARTAASARSAAAAAVPGGEPASGLRLGPIGQVSLYIRDVARAERFYGETLGLPHVFTFGDLAFYDLGGVRLYLQRVEDAKWRPGSVLYFLVDDIHAAWAELGARGVKQTGAPHNIYTDAESGVEEWMAFFEDTEGNMLSVMSRVAPSG